MHVYLEWFASGRPTGQRNKEPSDVAAMATVRARFPAATFGPKTPTAHQPAAFNIAGIQDVRFAYDGPMLPGKDPVAQILYPAP